MTLGINCAAVYVVAKNRIPTSPKRIPIHHVSAKDIESDFSLQLINVITIDWSLGFNVAPAVTSGLQRHISVPLEFMWAKFNFIRLSGRKYEKRSTKKLYGRSLPGVYILDPKLRMEPGLRPLTSTYVGPT